MSKYTYKIETFHLNQWLCIVKCETRDFCIGYITAKQYLAPRNAHRIVRSDGKIMPQELSAQTEVNIGMVAGWPTAEQYEAAAARALNMAEQIRKHTAQRISPGTNAAHNEAAPSVVTTPLGKTGTCAEGSGGE